jgi:hypothetical protein
MGGRSVDKKWFGDLLRSRGYRSQKEFAQAIGLDGPKLTHLLNGSRRPQLDEVLTMSVILKISPVNLFRCFGLKYSGGSARMVSISATIHADDTVKFHDPLPAEHDVELPADNYRGTAVLVGTDTLSPRYFHGEVLCARIPEEDSTDPNELDRMLGREVFVSLYDGELLLKVLHPGSRRRVYSLASLNIRFPPLIDVKVFWARPVDFHIPGWKRSK